MERACTRKIISTNFQPSTFIITIVVDLNTIYSLRLISFVIPYRKLSENPKYHNNKNCMPGNFSRIFDQILNFQKKKTFSVEKSEESACYVTHYDRSISDFFYNPL